MPKPYEPTPPTEAADALNELKSLPSFEETKTQVQNAVNEITSAASKIIPTLRWETLHGGAADNCERPYEQTGGQRYFLPDATAVKADVSERDWAVILQAAQDSAAKIGATNTQVIHDQPGNHDVWFSGPTGVFIKIGYKGNLVVSGYTGCRLPQSKK